MLAILKLALPNRPATVNAAYEQFRMVLHWVLTIVLGWWFVCLAWPDDLFSTSVSLRVFATTLPKPIWASVFCLSALVGVWGYIYRETNERLVIATAILATTHMLVALLVLSSGVPSTGIGAYGGWGFVAYYLMWTWVKVPYHAAFST